MSPRFNSIRYRVDPRDVPAEKAARRLHLSSAEFAAKLPELLARGFPAPDPTTGMYDLTTIDEWMTARHGGQPRALTAEAKPRDARTVFNERRGACRGA
jgi:hypothetical protein